LVSLFVWRLPFDLSSKGGPASSYATAGIALRVTAVLKPPHHDKVEAPMRRLLIRFTAKSVAVSHSGPWPLYSASFTNSSLLSVIKCYITLDTNICQLSKAQWSLYTTSLTFNSSMFCPHSVFVWIPEQPMIIPLYSINWLVFIPKMQCVYCVVWAESLNYYLGVFSPLCMESVLVKFLVQRLALE